MDNAVLKSASYVLVHTPDMILHNGTTQTSEKLINPDSDYLKNIHFSIRSYDDVVAYAPNQAYIGNINPDQLAEVALPWHANGLADATRTGKYGEILPQDEFIALLKLADCFDLVQLSSSFVAYAKEGLATHPLFGAEADKLGEGVELSAIESAIADEHAEAIYHQQELVGCVKRAHDIDLNLTAHVLYENLVVKASGALALAHLIDKSDIEAGDIDYIIECSEEACGDMNQRGGGNFAKAIAEMCGAVNATGSDTRGFCAAPLHALVQASALVRSGVYKNVAIVAGGATAKLGMNGKDHVKKEIPILEDVLGGFATLVSANDGVSPVLRTDLVGRHTVGTGSSPQAVITSLVTEPLDKAGWKITDIDKYSVEMQNPDVTKPAGAGDVPEANYKMIGALAVKRKDMERTDLPGFVKSHGMPGWAPTQGHIPSGVPYLGFAREDLTGGELQRTMVIGKGSLFLGRMTNQFDGVSIVIERNSGQLESAGQAVSEEQVKSLIAASMKDFASHLLSE